MSLDLNIQDIIGDLARPNLFEVNIDFAGENFKFYCHAASLPASTVGEAKVNYQNRAVNYPGDRTFADWKLTIYNDADHKMRRLFVEWSELVQKHGRTIGGALPAEIKQIGFVQQFNRAGDPTAKYKFTGLWPKDVGEIALSWTDGSEIESFDATMSVDWFEAI